MLKNGHDGDQEQKYVFVNINVLRDGWKKSSKSNGGREWNEGEEGVETVRLAVVEKQRKVGSE